MILPIFAYGQPVLKKEAEDITKDYPELETLLENMWETMYNAKGIGLAAPQIGLGIRLFLVDTKQIQEEGEEEKGIKKAFINATILEEEGKAWAYEEGCLSIPGINGDVMRQPKVTIEYMDENFNLKEETYEGMNARVIQHEYDHIDGVLFTELLKPLKKRLIKKKLERIKDGMVPSDYRMKFVPRRR
ncbi:MAG: peptide deformylase [Saprospiraceae bacterium]